MQLIARTAGQAAPAGLVRATAAGTPGSSQTARSPAMSVVTLAVTLVVTLAMVSLAKQVYLKSVLFNERNPKS